MKMKRGMGTSVYDVTPSKAFLTRSSMPADPPRTNHAPTTFTVRKAKTTGRPSSIRAMTEPKSSVSVSSQPIETTIDLLPGIEWR